mgnify:CR=1 FL=1
MPTNEPHPWAALVTIIALAVVVLAIAAFYLGSIDSSLRTLSGR